MRRKLVKQGNNALTITLPHAWLKKFNLKPGNEVTIEEKGRGLYIDIQTVEGDVKELNVPSIDKFMRRLIHVWYTMGYDELKVTYNDTQTIDLIHTIVEELLGFEIVEQGSNYCIIKNISKESEADFDSSLRRVFLMIKTMGDELLGSLNKGNYSYLSQIANQDRMINKLTFFCERLLNKFGYPSDYKRTNFIFTLVWSLEHISDEYRDICRNFAETKAKLNKKDLINISNVNELFNLLYTTFYQPTLDNLIELRNNSIELYNQLYEAFEKNQGDRVLLHHLLKIADKINNMTHLVVS